MKDARASLFGIALAGITAVALPFTAHANLALAQKHACTACHTVDKKLVGPAYQEVAKKYAADKNAVDMLAASIRAGGTGKWGPVPMPAQPNLSEVDAKARAAWVLGGAK